LLLIRRQLPYGTMRKETTLAILLLFLQESVLAFVSQTIQRPSGFATLRRTATIAKNDEASSQSSSSSSSTDSNSILDCMSAVKTQAVDYANQFGLDPSTEGAFYALFLAIRLQDFVRQQKPFVLRHEQVQKLAWGGDDVAWPGFFGMDHLEQALEDDFLDAARGSTNNREGWKVRYHCFFPWGDAVALH